VRDTAKLPARRPRWRLFNGNGFRVRDVQWAMNFWMLRLTALALAATPQAWPQPGRAFVGFIGIARGFLGFLLIADYARGEAPARAQT